MYPSSSCVPLLGTKLALKLISGVRYLSFSVLCGDTHCFYGEAREAVPLNAQKVIVFGPLATETTGRNGERW